MDLTSFDFKPGTIEGLENSNETVKNETIKLSQDQRSSLLKALIGKEQKVIREDRALSYGQKALWFIYKNSPDNASYNQGFSVRIYNEISKDALQKAFQKIADKHPLLRSTYTMVENEPVMNIENNFKLLPEEVDATQWSPEVLNEEVKAAHKRPFNLEKGPLIRVHLFKCSKADYVMLITIHHIVTDGSSMLNVLNDFKLFYNAEINDEEITLHPPEGSYFDFVKEQAKMFESKRGEELFQYWHQQLEGVSHSLNLPLDKPRPILQTYNGASFPVDFDNEFTTSLREMAISEGVTLYMVLLSALQVLLHRISGQNDILIGTPAINRPSKKYDNLVGYFVNLVVIKGSFRDDPTFKEVLNSTKHTVLNAISHQEYPFSMLVDKLQITRDPGRHPVFQVSFVLQSVRQREDAQLVVAEKEQRAKWGALELEPYEFDKEESPFDITVELLEGKNSLSGSFKYNKDLFNESTIARLVDCYKEMLKGILNNTQSKIGILPLLNDKERHLLLNKFNCTSVDYPADATIQALVEAQVKKTPEAEAIIFEDKKLTYRELNEKANQLAHYLRVHYKVGPDDIIGLMTDRSERMIIAILGILKAGGAYLPLDPAYPKERIQYIISDARVKLLLTETEYMFDLDYYRGDLFALDIQLSDLKESKDNPIAVNNSRDLAYVIYTSGSTGQPKGVMIEHRSNLNMSLSQIREFRVTPNDKVLQFASLSFDASVYEIFMALYSGASIVLVRKEVIKDAEHFVNHIAEKGVTVATLPPAYLSVLPLDTLRFLRVIITAGEAANVVQASYCAEFLEYYNAYGPTECAVCVSTYRVHTSDGNRTRIPIGSPVSNTELYILDKNKELVPVGVEGEICVSGVGLARGYLNKEELTASKFIANPFKPEERLYLTGDIGKWLEDGNIEFTGRKDEQVKLRGYRIELGEITHTLQSHNGVEDAHVYLEEDKNGEKSLVAVVTADKANAYTLKQLLKLKKTHFNLLQQQLLLPNGMVIFHKNPGETELIYKEIFEEKCYFRNGISLKEGDVVFDIGANIGMFSLYAGLAFQGVKIYAFEPLPPIYEYLSSNFMLYDLDVTTFNYGIADEESTVKFSYYPHNTAISGRYGNQEEEHSVVKNFMLNQLQDESIQLDNDQLEEILTERMQSEEYDCQLRRLSDVIREQEIGRIDLLKIDVEKSELDVIRSIDKEDWKKIRQVVIEVHDIADHVEQITDLLKEVGFIVYSDQEVALKNTNIYNIYGLREEKIDERIEDASDISFNKEGSWVSLKALLDDLKGYCQKKLPEYMVPTQFKLLDKIPLTVNGKVDYKAISELEGLEADTDTEEVGPRNRLEETLAEIWKEVLGLDKVSIKDNFFQVGGHSLKATQVMSRIHKELNTKIELSSIFSSPTIEGLAELISSSDITTYQSISIVPQQEHYALSHAQKRLWILNQLEENQIAYNIPGACMMEGAFDQEAFIKAFDTIVARHESLRTTFITVEDQPRQKINEGREWSIAWIDLTKEEEREAQSKALAKEEAAFPFDLSQGFLFRVKVLKLEEEKHILLCTMHHIIADGLSLEVLVNELKTYYNAFIKGESNVLPPLQLQYKDFAAWQNEQLQSDQLEIHKQYWLDQFIGEIPVIELPTDFLRPAVKTYNGSRIDILLEKELSNAIKAVAEQYEASLFMMLLASVNVFLYKYTGQTDIVIGSPVAGRDHADLEDQIGFYINTLALRSTFSSQQSFENLLNQVKKIILGAYEHQLYPFDTLVNDLNLDRDMSHSPLFDVMVAHHTTQLEALGLQGMEGITVKDFKSEYNISKFDLNFTFTESDENLAIQLEYNTDLFTPVRIQQMLLHFQNLLKSIAKNSQVLIKEIDILTEEEKSHLFHQFNNTVTPYSEEKTLHTLFEEQVIRTPKHPALRQHGHEVSYEELNKLANQLAWYLISNGVKTGDNVGLIVGRSFNMMAGMLAILKTGAAYVPIDPAYPTDRQLYIIQNSKVGIVLTDQHYAVKEINQEGLEYLSMEDNIHDFSGNNPKIPESSNDLAYTIYTSGSTGRPKGVMIAHHSAVNLVEWVNKTFNIGHEDRLLFITSMCFDLSVYDIFGMLACGGTIVIAEQDEIHNAVKLQRMLVEERITFWDSVPSTLNYLMSELEEGEENYLQNDLRLVFMSGDWIPVSLPGRIVKYFPQANVISLGGATEGTVWSNYYPVEYFDTTRSSVPYGRPIDNNFFYILDNDLNPVPQGSVGELYIGGAGVAAGYANDAEKTAGSFVEDPFLKTLGGRMYKTGDLGRMLLDWNMEFIGRKDNQVKIRGYRVELGEIKNSLLHFEAIESAEVIIKENVDKVKHLIAYYVSNDQEVEIDSLRHFLRERLPEYMIPTFFVQLEKIPLTANGKIDYKGLPQPETPKLEANMSFVTPRNFLEGCLVELFSKVLGRAQVSIEDNFFNIGGDSIKAIQISSRLYKEGFKLEVRNIFQHPTISELASSITLLENKADQGVVSAQIPLTAIQKEFFQTLRIEPSHFNQAVMLQAASGFDEAILKAVFAKLQEHHDALRMNYKSVDGQIVQVNEDLNYPFSLKSYDLRQQEDHASEILNELVNHIQSSLDLENGPMMKLALFHMPDGDRLLIVIHHLVIDGISWRVLLEDIDALYQQILKREKLSLPPKTDSFKIWSERVADYANSETLRKEVSYWQTLEASSAGLIPQDFEVADNLIKDCTTLSFKLNAAETELLLTKVNHAFNTEINDILLTGLGLGIKESFGTDKYFLTLEGHGREEIAQGIDVGRTIGWFTSMYPVLLDVSQSNDDLRAIKEIKESLRKVPRKGVGYGILKYISDEDVKQHLSFDIKPQISFNYLGQLDTDLDKISFHLAQESAGETQNSNESREHLLDISGMIKGGELSIGICYNQNQFKIETIQKLIDAYQFSLKKLISNCCEQKVRRHTPSDFTYKSLSIDALEELTSLYEIEDIYPLSPMQEGMLFYAMMDNRSLAYFEQFSFRLKGLNDLSCMHEALRMLVRRYGVLRTKIVYKDYSRPLQIVLRDQETNFQTFDLRKKTFEGKESFICEYKDNDKQNTFDLSKDNLMRVAVMQLEDDILEVVWSFHHILMDGWSLGIVTAEFFEMYQHLLQQKQPVQLPFKPYKNYITWLENQNPSISKAFWAEYLKGYEEPAGLPKMKSPSLSGKAYKNEKIIFTFNENTTNSLNKLAGKNKVTLNTIIQTVWGILLSKYNNTNDVVFGGVVSGRPSAIDGVESMVGLFINTVPVRVKSDENVSFTDLLQQVQKETIEAEKHHYLPLADIQNESDLKQNLLDHILVFENYPISEQLKENKTGEIDLKISDIYVFEQTNYNFNILVTPGTELSVRFEFNENVYDKNFIENIKNHFLNLSEQIVAKEHISVDQLELLSVPEIGQILYEFNNTIEPYGKDRTMHALFEEQASKTPDQVALSQHGREMTYQSLNEKANQLTRLIIEKGVKPGDNVGLIADRSFEMIIGLMAILKAGAAYVPIDPIYPVDRQQYIITNSEVSFVIMDQVYPVAEDYTADIQYILLDGVIDSYATTNLEIEKSSQDLAYTIYTSGSTGRPKGVMIAHHSAVNLIEWVNKTFEVGTKDRMLFITSMCFDLSVYDIFGMLACGGTVVIAQQEEVQDVTKLQALLKQEKITFWDSVPTTMNFLTSELEEGTGEFRQNDLRLVFMSGDWIPVNLPARLKKFFPNAEVISLGGATEGTVWSNYYPVKDIDMGRISIPYGKPISNNFFYILDKNLKPVPQGVVGDLYIGGVGVALGYANDPDKTDFSFKEDPFNKQLGGRMYRTGDLGRMLSDWNMEFIGRKDHQIKIRGYRVELGEIKNTMLQHELIGNVEVIAREDAMKLKYLILYYTTPDNTLSASALRSYLEESLPDYMIPSYFVVLDKFPLTSNGKIDYKSLPDPQLQNFEGGVIEAPVNDVERKLIAIWEEVLGLDQIGTNQSFFEIGGHSLKATRVITRISQQFNVQVPLRSIFTYPTIKQQAEIVAQSLEIVHEEIPVVSFSDYYDVSHAQKRLWILDQLENNQAAYNISGAYTLRGELNKEAFEKALQTIVARHESLRTTFIAVGGEPKQKIHSDNLGFQVIFSDLRLHYNNEKKAKELAEQDAGQGFNLEEGPLLRAKLLHLSYNKYVFLFTMHHIISDGWSVDVLVKELLTLYKDFSENKKLPAGSLSIQYKDFAAWQNKKLTEDQAGLHRQYWKKQFEGEVPVLELPVDFTRPVVKTYKGDLVHFKIGNSLSQSLHKLSQNQETTLFTSLLATVKALLYKYTNQEDIVLGAPIAGRTHQALENQIGFYVNTLALRTRFKRDESFSQLLNHVKKGTLEAYEHEFYPFDCLVDDLELSRDMSRSPLFDVMVVLQNAAVEGSDIKKLDGLVVEEFETAFHLSKFDLTFIFKELQDGIQLTVEYNTDLFKRERIEKMVFHYERLLGAILEDPDYPLSSINYISTQEKQQMLKWGQAYSIYPRNKTVVGLFEEQVTRNENALAVSYVGQRLTYGELNQKANQFAHFFREDCQIKSDDLIGVMMDRSEKMIISILGIIKAGTAYVPIDPAYPKDRIKYMLDDTSVKVLLIDKTEWIESYDLQNRNVFSLDRDWDKLGSYSTENPTHLNKSNDLAYVMYTSGSTGRPKGVMVEHRSIIRLVMNTNYISIKPNENLLQTGALCFDATTFEMWGMLLHGGALHLASNEILMDVVLLKQMILEKQISMMWFTAAWFNQLVDADVSLFHPLKSILVGGDKLSPKHINKIKETYPDLKVINGYGPTENTTFSICHRIDQKYEMSIPLGRPICNSTAYILDPYQNILPVGIVGEIYLGGDGLARGYLNNEELTKEKFIQNPFGEGRLYRTGDLGKWLSDGTLEFSGRKDNQVKIRGFRIEIEEIENVLAKYDFIEDAVVTANEGENGLKELVAYIVSNRELLIAEIRSYLKLVLPDYMIPSYFVQMEILPLTTNGKVDRKALPSPEGIALDAGETYVAPETEMERLLVNIFGEVLLRSNIGLRDNFFESGGDSIKAIQIASRLHREGYKVHVRDIFQHPQIVELKNYIKKSTREIDQSKVSGKVPCTPIQKEFLLSNKKTPHHFNQAVMLHAPAGFNIDAIKAAGMLLQEHHDILRLVCKNEGGKTMLFIQENASPLSLQVYDITSDENPSAAIEILSEEVQQSINLKSGPLMKLALFHAKDGDRLLIVIHHLAVDGVSWRILLEDFEMIYNQSLNKEKITLPLKTDSFKTWSEALSIYAHSEDILKEEKFWSRIEGEQVPPIPRDFSGGAKHLTEMQLCSFTLSQEDTEMLQTKVNAAFNTEINDILLTALGLGLKATYGLGKVAIALEGHGREDLFKDVDVSRTVGWFTSIYPLVLPIPDTEDLSLIIKETKEYIHKVPHKGIGYGVLKYLRATGDVHFKLRPSISFNFLGQFDNIIKDQAFGPAKESYGNTQNETEERTFDIEVSGMIIDKSLTMSILYNKIYYKALTIQILADHFEAALNQLITYCTQKEEKELTPSDLGFSELSVNELENFFN